MVWRRAAISSGYAPPACAGSRLGASANSLLAGRFHPREGFVFQEPGGAEGVDQVLFQFADLQVAGDAHQHRAQVEVRLPAVEAVQAFDQRRRDDQHRVGIAVGVADKEAWPVGRGGRNEVQGIAQAREWVGQVS